MLLHPVVPATAISEVFVLLKLIAMIVVKVKKQALCGLFSQFWDLHQIYDGVLDLDACLIHMAV